MTKKQLSKNEIIKENSQLLRGNLTASLRDEITNSISNDDQQVIKFHGSYQQDDRDRRAEREEKFLEPLYSFMIRLRIPGGEITNIQWQDINEISQKYSNGNLKITTRETLQLHGLIKADLKNSIIEFSKSQLDSIAACGDVNRNVLATSHPAQNAAEEEVFGYAKKISEAFLPHTNAYHEIWLNAEKISPETEKEKIYGPTYLPRKFKIAIATPPYNDTDIFANDVGLIAIIENKQLLGFNLLAGGGMGMTHGDKNTYPRLASNLGYVAKADIIKIITAIITTQRNYGDRSNRKQARLKYTIDRHGLDWFINQIEKRSDIILQESKNYQFKHRTDFSDFATDYRGKYSYSLFVENGVIKYQSNLLNFLNEIAKFKDIKFRFTSNQNLIISNLSEQQKISLETLMQEYKINNNSPSQLRKASQACVALNTCPLALAEGQRYLPSLIDKIEEIIKELNLADQAITIRMTGCPNGCARPYLAEIGLIGKSYGRYNLHIGGDHLGQRLNQLYLENLDEEAILSNIRDLLSKYKQNSNIDESFGDFTNHYILKNE